MLLPSSLGAKVFLLTLAAVCWRPEDISGQTRVNGRIAFSRVQMSGDSQIFLANADGSGLALVSGSCSKEINARWSPDGTKIVFVANCEGNDEVYSEDADGSNRLRLTNNSIIDDSPTWSPDGRTIAFVSLRDFGQPHIYLMSPEGSNQRRLTSSVGIGEGDPDWSPDGGKIAYVRPPVAGSSDVDIFSINGDGTDPVNLTNNPSPDRQPEWSPDGTRIVFTSLRNNNTNVYLMNADGSNQIKLDSLAGDSSPTWSPDGNTIIFSSLANGNNDDIYIMNPDGSNLTVLIATALHDSLPAWQPMLAPTFTPTLISASSSMRAIALDSVTMLREPFAITNTKNFSPDQRTRIMLFAVYTELGPGEDASAVTAEAEDSQHRVFPLSVEYVGRNSSWAWLTQINVKLPDGLESAGDVLMSLKLHGSTSNKVLVNIQ